MATYRYNARTAGETGRTDVLQIAKDTGNKIFDEFKSSLSGVVSTMNTVDKYIDSAFTPDTCWWQVVCEEIDMKGKKYKALTSIQEVEQAINKKKAIMTLAFDKFGREGKNILFPDEMGHAGESFFSLCALFDAFVVNRFESFAGRSTDNTA